MSHTFSRMRSSTGVAEVEAILVAVRENTRRGRKPEREVRGSIEGDAAVPFEDKGRDMRSWSLLEIRRGFLMLSDENRETAIGHGVGGLLLWEWCAGRGLSVASSASNAFSHEQTPCQACYSFFRNDKRRPI